MFSMLARALLVLLALRAGTAWGARVLRRTEATTAAVDWSLLEKATSPGNAPTPGWLFHEIVRGVRNSPRDVPDVAEYLMQCVNSDDLSVQLKAVLTIKHLASEEQSFQRYLGSCQLAMKILNELARPPQVAQARALESNGLQTVRAGTQKALDAIANPHTMEKQTAAVSLKSKIQGFGNFEPPKEEEPEDQGVMGQVAYAAADAVGDMVDDFRSKGAVGALKNASVDAVDLLLDGLDSIWDLVVGGKSENTRICTPVGQAPPPGPAPTGFQPEPQMPSSSSSAYAAAFGGGVVGASNPIPGLAPAQPAGPTQPLNNLWENGLPPKPSPKPPPAPADLLDLDAGASATPSADATTAAGAAGNLLDF